MPVKTSDLPKEYKKLDFKPALLRSWTLLVAVAFFLCCIAMTMFVYVKGNVNGGRFHVTTMLHYLALRYGPTILGTITALYWRGMTSTLGRMTPYIALADPTPLHDGRGVLRKIGNRYANNTYMMHFNAMYTDGHYILLACVAFRWVIDLILVPVKASFLQISSDGTGWTVTPEPHCVWFLICLYAGLCISAVYLLRYLWDRPTGVRWDPVSLADQLALLQQSNIMSIMSLCRGVELECACCCREFLKRKLHAFGELRLGYWKHKKTGKIWHGIASVPGMPKSSFSRDLFSNSC